MSMNDSKVREMDLRRLEPPGPMQEALSGIHGLRSGEALRIHTRFRPVFLIEQIEGPEHTVDSIEAGADHWQTTITRQ